MKAITLFDPWATLVVLGQKQFETRSWPTNHRGLLAIHVSKTSGFDELATVEPFLSVFKGMAHWHAPGCIIGTVEVMDCWQVPGRTIPSSFAGQPISVKERAFGDFSPGRYAWMLKNPRRLATPIPCRGRQGLWNVPPEIEALLNKE
ncbi:MAG: ASCH domain-containing protein [Pseudomonadota bacterium]|nr:ASCH domain-containing protein [Pseudomonadota bacterium]